MRYEYFLCTGYEIRKLFNTGKQKINGRTKFTPGERQKAVREACVEFAFGEAWLVLVAVGPEPR